jgi:hypothetical protein
MNVGFRLARVRCRAWFGPTSRRHCGPQLDSGQRRLPRPGQHRGGSASVTLNGKDLGAVNQVNPVIDLGTALRPGASILTVTIATTLLSRLPVTRPTVYTQPSQDYGLIGPVTITPYVDASLTWQKP